MQKYFSVRVGDNEVKLTVFDLEGPVGAPGNPDHKICNIGYGSAYHATNFAAVIAYALSLNAIPATEEILAKVFHED